ncbi:hypothetical protein PALB_22290 [Pseudoalteromonas luteoviolacea B = ATCC 29581]|nr:hypothetical protein PALB_22290 [Pseudoalteromonas luteoviolacea B = ATCC 29581]
MITRQVIYVLIFALFGMATTDLVRFLYFNWRYNEIRVKLILRVTGYAIMVVLLAVFGPVLISN